jgi:hypothetical protein
VRCALVLAVLVLLAGPRPAVAAEPLAFAAFAEDSTQLRHALILAESIRTFGGESARAPIRVYLPEGLREQSPAVIGKFSAFGVPLRTIRAPEDALGFPFARKVFAAARAEAEAESTAAILVWLDEDTILLKEPGEFRLAAGRSLGYRPVMHRNIGSLHAEPPDSFWTRVYRDLAVPDSALFPMRTVADGQTLRPYFNAGLLVVRPARGLLRKWAADFPRLYRDPVLVAMCRRDPLRNLFLHQAALAGAVLTRLSRAEMVELSDHCNYPIFFKEMYGAVKEFGSIHGVVTLRYDVYFRNPAPDWSEKLKGPPATIAWLKERLGR